MSRYLLTAWCIILIGCRPVERPLADIPVTPRDTTITLKNAFTQLHLDSQLVQQFLDSSLVTDTSRLLISNFYNSRNYQYAWFDEKGLSEHARMLWNLYLEYSQYARSAPATDIVLRNQMQEWLSDSSEPSFTAANARRAELQLTRLFFDYAFAKYIGNLEPADLQWYIPRRKVDISGLLDSLVSGAESPINDWEPLHPQYSLLKNKLLDYTHIGEQGGWEPISLGDRKKLQQGDKDTLILHIKRRLQTTDQYPVADTSMLFTGQLKDSIVEVQKQFGLAADGVIGSSTIKQLNVSVGQRIQQILINMERMRWLPRQPRGTWILANIPSFQLQVFEGDSAVLKMNIVVGTSATRTVIFSDDLKFVVFSPYWNVPASIVRNEILPAMKRDPGYLSRSNMQQTGTSNGLPVLRQLPGPGNALGQVKFLFPNNYNIYLHDSPAKSYFKESSRAFSHGCVRISEPFVLAKYLLRNDSTWTDEQIKKAMNAKKEKWVTLKEAVPVFITYFTSWVDNEGRLQFRNDIYSHDKRMAEHLFASNSEQ